ncbi:pyroglutamyl peptidase [Allonocardiopsis opalescens]|uniref:Pyrrolidone-carboxylate peptidase n=1 Tax=Allonocardiopsis opalescens TaxID=1144618 RepID=A0A2T0Q1S0_9ACTN|nr:pyroglutamyl peptidase [Allonocardiopsis opalescens]PRX97746.1 hypothetical protein CLV72_10596 [Allonocardiopsis opalescens]
MAILAGGGLRRAVGAGGLVGALLLTAPGTAAAHPAGGGAACTEPGAAVTVEEARRTGPVPQEILARSGFAERAAAFASALCGADSPAQAQRLVERHGERLWEAAVDRVRGRGPAGGDLSRGDDRPLYWARLEMTAALRQWRPEFALSDGARAELIAGLERHSRGQESMRTPAGADVTRMIVTGFDPFQLDGDIRRSNPSGAAALALDGVRLDTPSGPVVVQTALFPVRWRDFADGMVERALLPHYGRRGADLVVTVSQGRDGRFDIERYNGAWRGGSPDNENAGTAETVPIPGGVPTVEPQPQWTETTLPYQEILAAGTGPFPVYDNTQVTEIPAGQTAPVMRPDGPTPGSTARSGGGGNYLSNEIAYRNTLLRDALDRGDVAAGHVHTPILFFGAGNTTEVTDPEFERNREEITAQVRAIAAAAAAAG